MAVQQQTKSLRPFIGTEPPCSLTGIKLNGYLTGTKHTWLLDRNRATMVLEQEYSHHFNRYRAVKAIQQEKSHQDILQELRHYGY